MHVNFLKLNAHRDQLLAAYAVAEDYVLVTNNGVDYRPIYRSIDVHPGVVVIIPNLPRMEQIVAFRSVLTVLEGERDVINKLIEADADGGITISDFSPFRDNL